MKMDMLVNGVMVLGILSLFLVPTIMVIHSPQQPGKLIIIGLAILAVPAVVAAVGMQRVNRMEYCLERTRQRAEIIMALALWGVLALLIILIFLPKLLRAMIAT